MSLSPPGKCVVTSVPPRCFHNQSPDVESKHSYLKYYKTKKNFDFAVVIILLFSISDVYYYHVFYINRNRTDSMNDENLQPYKFSSKGRQALPNSMMYVYDVAETMIAII